MFLDFFGGFPKHKIACLKVQQQTRPKAYVHLIDHLCKFIETSLVLICFILGILDEVLNVFGYLF